MTVETVDAFVQLLSDIRDGEILIAALRHEKKEGVTTERRNEIDGHVRVLEAQVKYLSGQKTWFVAQVISQAAGVPRPSFDATATHPVGERIREIAVEMGVDLAEELAPWRESA